MNTEYKIFDSHAHYDDEEFDNDRKEVLEELKNEGVIGIMNCSSSYKSIAKTCELINTYDFIYGAVGIHPENADEFKDEIQITKGKKPVYINWNEVTINDDNTEAVIYVVNSINKV